MYILKLLCTCTKQSFAAGSRDVYTNAGIKRQQLARLQGDLNYYRTRASQGFKFCIIALYVNMLVYICKVLQKFMVMLMNIVHDWGKNVL